MRSSLLFSLGSVEFCNTSTAAACIFQGRGAHSCPPPWIRALLHVPAAASSPQALFNQCIVKTKPAQPIHGACTSIPGAHFEQKQFFLGFAFSLFPVVLFILGVGVCFLELWRLVCSVVSFVPSLSPTSQSKDLSAILSQSSGPHRLPGQQPSCSLSSSGDLLAQWLCLFWVLLFSFSKLLFFHLNIFCICLSVLVRGERLKTKGG